jgi:hypothetical protein
MRSIGAIAFVLFTVMAPRASLAQASDVDWKLYGGDTVGGTSFCFYDAHGVVRVPEDHIRVWIKCLSQKDMDGITLNDNSANKSAKKLLDGYVPPIVVVRVMSFDQIVDITAAEEIANTGLPKPRAEILYELNCSERKLRELSIHIHENGKFGSSDRPRDWKYVPPEGNAAILLKILCRA